MSEPNEKKQESVEPLAFPFFLFLRHTEDFSLTPHFIDNERKFVAIGRNYGQAVQYTGIFVRHHEITDGKNDLLLSFVKIKDPEHLKTFTDKFPDVAGIGADLMSEEKNQNLLFTQFPFADLEVNEFSPDGVTRLKFKSGIQRPIDPPSPGYL